MPVIWVKALHIAIFILGAVGVCYVIYSGIVNRITRLTWIVISLMLLEVVALGLNGWRCPLTTLAEDLGAESGSITYILLPDWLAPHVFTIGGILFALGVFLVIYRHSQSSRAAPQGP